MRLSGFPLLAAILAGFLAGLLAGCGYRHGAGPGPCPPGNLQTLAIVRVDNSTLNTTLPQELRSLFRDELVRRSCGTFVDAGQADGLLHLSVLSLQEGARVEDPDGNTVKLEVQVSLEARLTRRLDGVEVWSGATVSYETFFGTDAQTARRRALELGVRQLADRLVRDF